MNFINHYGNVIKCIIPLIILSYRYWQKKFFLKSNKTCGTKKVFQLKLESQESNTDKESSDKIKWKQAVEQSLISLILLVEPSYFQGRLIMGLETLYDYEFCSLHQFCNFRKNLLFFEDVSHTKVTCDFKK